MAGPKWKEAYYLPEDRYVGVDYLLSKRRPRHPFREGDAWSSKVGFETGGGLKLLPVDNSKNDRRNCIRAFPGQQKMWSLWASHAGFSTRQIESQRNQIVRFNQLKDDMLYSMNNDDELRSSMSINHAIQAPQIGRTDSPDIIVYHNDDFERESTLISIVDRHRKRDLDAIEEVFTLDIKKWTFDNCTMFDKYGKPMLIRYWERHQRGIERKRARVSKTLSEQVRRKEERDAKKTIEKQRLKELTKWRKKAEPIDELLKPVFESIHLGSRRLPTSWVFWLEMCIAEDHQEILAEWRMGVRSNEELWDGISDYFGGPFTMFEKKKYRSFEALLEKLIADAQRIMTEAEEMDIPEWKGSILCWQPYPTWEYSQLAIGVRSRF
jgi:hypothetical protein